MFLGNVFNTPIFNTSILANPCIHKTRSQSGFCRFYTSQNSPLIKTLKKTKK